MALRKTLLLPLDEGARRARGDPQQRKQRFLRRVGVVDEAEDGVGHVMQHADRIPGAAIPDREGLFRRDPDQPTLAWHEAYPNSIDPKSDIHIPPGPDPCRARGHEVSVAIGGARRRHCAGAVEDRELHNGIHKAQGLVVGDMLLGLGCQEIRQTKVGGGVRHGRAFRSGG